MKQKYDFLPRRLKKEEVALAPTTYIRLLFDYPSYRNKAIKESKPGYNTLMAILLTAIVKRDRRLIDFALDFTNENVPKYVYLTLAGSALCDLGSKDKGFAMLRDAVELHPSHSLLLILASETDDPEEKENLAKKVLNENPQDCDAIRHLAYAKYVKGEREEAERLIDKVLSIEPSNIYALENKASSCFNRGEYHKALDYLLKINLKPTPVSLQLKVCHCYYLLGMTSKAKRIAKKIEDKIPRAYDIEGGIENAQELLTEILNS